MIHLKNICKSYHGQQVLHEVSLDIHQGEIFGMIGKSGAGKSTLLRSINLLERPDSGAVIVNDQDLCQLKPKALRQARHKIAMIFQHFNLLQEKNVYDNIALAMRIQGDSEEKIQAKVSELLTLVELSDKARSYPASLSGGQKQRVAIARALSTSPEILLCDEATSALDPQTTTAILALLKKINQDYGISIVLITHEMDVIKSICHRLAVMEKGRIVEVTRLSEAFQNEQSIAAELLFASLEPALPSCLASRLEENPSDRLILRLFFKGEKATLPFISQISRTLAIDVNILQANIDRFDSVSCGVLVVEVHADAEAQIAFLAACKASEIQMEKLGYVREHVL